MSVLFKIADGIVFVTWDVGLSLKNLVTPKRPEGHIIPEGHPGFGGNWPEYVPPKEGDSRCCCPGLNAMANHGILPRDGKNIQFKELTRVVHATFNFSTSFSYLASKHAADTLKRDYGKDKLDLSEIDLHNGIEHDASLCREDSAINPDQSKPHEEYIKGLLASATGKNRDGDPILTVKDLSKYLSKRRADSRSKNKDFTLSFVHRIFGSANACNFLGIFGGRVKDLEIFLLEERIPEGWECRTRNRAGLTFAKHNLNVFRVEFGIDEKKYLAEKAAGAGDTTTGVVATSSVSKGSLST